MMGIYVFYVYGYDFFFEFDFSVVKWWFRGRRFFIYSVF